MLFPTFLQKPGKKFSPADQEDRRRGGQPEEAVQQAAKGGADQAEIEDGPHSQPGGQGEGLGVGLGGGGEGHPRKRRARKETGSSGSW